MEESLFQRWARSAKAEWIELRACIVNEWVRADDFSRAATIIGIITVAFLVGVLITGCEKKAPPPVSFNTLEDGRAQARSNAEFNAAAYRAENPRMQGLKIVSHGDTSQNSECPQGSGWATLSIMNVDKERNTVEKYKVVCSTVSAAIGCFLETDFEKTPHSIEANQCNRTLPYPLPKIGK